MILKHSTEPSPEVGLQTPVLRRGGEEQESRTPGDKSGTLQLSQVCENKDPAKEEPRTHGISHRNTASRHHLQSDQRQSSQCPHLPSLQATPLLTPCTLPTPHPEHKLWVNSIYRQTGPAAARRDGSTTPLFIVVRAQDKEDSLRLKSLRES